MNDEKERGAKPLPSYWAVLPAGIRYDDRIPPNAKLLYAEISSLTDRTGYCWAEDAYFAGLYRITERTVRSLLRALKEQGYIRIERDAGEHNATVARRIYAGLNPLGGAGPSLENNFQTEFAVRKKFSGSSEENFQTDLIKNKQEIITGPRATRKRRPPRASPDWKPERFLSFWSFYRKIPGEGGRARNENKQAAMDAWDALRPEDELLAVIGRALLRQLKTPEWQRGVGIPMAATYLNQARWEDAAEMPEGREDPSAAPQDDRSEVRVPWI